MKKFLSCFYCIVFFTILVSCSLAQGNRIEDIVSKITGEDYEKTKSRISSLTKQLQEGDNFHALKEYSSRGLSHVKNDPSFQFNFMLEYECKMPKQYLLSQAHLTKRGHINMKNKLTNACIFVMIAFSELKNCTVY